MRKFITFLMAFVLMITFANAQTVESSRLFENFSVNVNGGITKSLNNVEDSTFFSNIKPSFGIEIDKYFTPVVGIGVQGIANFDEFNINTLNRAFGLINGKINFSNWFGGYKGYPRRVEVVGVAGMGYGHNFADDAKTRHFSAYDAGAELNINLGEKRAWQINVRPTVIWSNENSVYPKLSIRDADVRLTAGVTYKFGSSSKKSHNFVICPFEVTQADYDALQAKYDDLANREPVVKEVVKTVTETKEVVKTETRVLVGSTVITFPIGSCVLSNVERQKVEMFANSLDENSLVQIVGSADSKTGTETRNFALAQNRANVVKNVLTELGITNDRINIDTKLDATNNVETSRSAILTLSVE